MMTMRNLTIAVAIGMLLSACASGAGDTRSAASPRAMANASATSSREARAATVVVENRNWSDMTVYAVHGGMRYRLGTVTSMSTARFRLPERALVSTQGVQLVADPIGSSSGYVSQGVQVYPGQQVAFTIQNHLAISSVAVFN
jgi:hypothetical protein